MLFSAKSAALHLLTQEQQAGSCLGPQPKAEGRAHVGSQNKRVTCWSQNINLGGSWKINTSVQWGYTLDYKIYSGMAHFL